MLPSAKIRLGVRNPSEDLVKVHSNAGISVLVEREIYEVLKQKKRRLIVTTSGLWKFKKLELRPELSWLLYGRRVRQPFR